LSSVTIAKSGPLVQVYTADHPRNPALRLQGYESGVPVRIRDRPEQWLWVHRRWPD
jgi:hypothetical protein